jgi:predicted PurR-regulated permease PerM
MSRWSPPLWYDRISGVAWRFIVAVAALSLLVSGIVAMSTVVLPVVLGLLFACALTPVARRLRRAGLSSGLSAFAALQVLIVALVAVCWLTLDAVVDQWPHINELLDSAQSTLEDWAADRGLDETTAASVSSQLGNAVGRTLDLLLTGLVHILPTLASLVTTLVLSLLVAFFFLKDGATMWRWITVRTGSGEELTNRIGKRVWTTITGFILGQTAISAIDATFISLGAAILGVPEPLAIFMLTFFGAYIPFIGAFLSGLLAVMLAVGDGGITEGLIMLLIVLAVQVIEGNVLQPWIQGRAVRLHPLVIALSVTAGGAIAGFLGIFLAVPATAAGFVALSELRAAGMAGPALGADEGDDEPMHEDRSPDEGDAAASNRDDADRER